MRQLVIVATIAVLQSAALAAPPTLRLDPNVRPTHYTLEVTVDPTQDRLTGVIDIAIQSAQALPVLWLNSEELTIDKASATAGAKTIAAKSTPVAHDFVGIAFDSPLPAGASVVHLEYHGKLAANEATGATRQKEGDEWYGFTQFEPIDARRAFPCFDEPSFKVPWKLALRIRSGNRAVSNTPEVESKDLGNGWKRVQFAESRPLPSYLIAWGVGPFDVVDGGKSKVSGTPVRIIVPKGEADRARWAAEITHQSLEQLEEWFGTPYPFEKLDCLAMPISFYGAMENPGLVTYAAPLILQKPGEETIARRRSYAATTTHELAHQWFGDLVTMSWWDDVWLNEAFATWMAYKILDTWQPTWGAAEKRIDRRDVAMSSDSLVSARQIRQPIVGNGDIKTAFDDITYQKGSTVILMFERLVGAEVFRRGVQDYLKKHARGNATASDFLAAISAAAARDIAPAFSTFLDQPGVPIVSFDLKCDGAPRLHLEQQRYLPKGSPGTSRASQLWQIPVCVRWPDGRACTLLTQASGDLALDGAKSCPAWVEPNDGGGNYYRAQPSADLLARLERAGLSSLTAPEKLSLVSDLGALAHAGRVGLSALLALAPKLAADSNRFVVESAAGAVDYLRTARIISDKQLPLYAKYLRRLFGARANQLGWAPHPGDDDDARLLRVRLVPLVADEGQDTALVAEAQKLASAWLPNHKAVDPDMVDGALTVAAHHGDRALYDRWMKAAQATKDRLELQRLLGALARFRDPALVKQSLPTIIDGTFEPSEAVRLVWGATREPATRPIVWSWFQDNYDPLIAKLPRDQGPSLARIPSSLCDDSQAPSVKSFLEPRMAKLAGGPRALAQSLETLHLCSVFRQDAVKSASHFFAGQN